MDTRRFVPALLVLMLPIEAHADRHKIGFRNGVADAERSSLWGPSFSTDFTIWGDEKDPNKKAKPVTVSVIIEGNVLIGTHKRVRVYQGTFAYGLRFTYNKWLVGGKPIEIFGQVARGHMWESQDGFQRRPTPRVYGFGLYRTLGSLSEVQGSSVGVALQWDRYRLNTSPVESYSQWTGGFVIRRHSRKIDGDKPGIHRPPDSSQP
jgi:hypothetical protein